MSKSESETANEGEAGGKKSSKKLVLIIVGLVVLLGLGGGGAWFFLHKKGDHGEKAAKPKPQTPPVFVTLEPFVVNLAGEASHYLQVGIDLKVADGKVGDAIKAHLPEIRNGVLLLLSSKQVDELGTLDGKNRLRDEIRAAVNRPLGIKAPQRKNKSSEDAAEHANGEKAADGVKAADGEKAADKAHDSDPHEDADEAPEGVQDVLLTSFVIQ